MLAFTPDFEAMKKPGVGTPIAHVCCLTKRCDPDKDGCHFVSRCFAPWTGINEDPATGNKAFLGFLLANCNKKTLQRLASMLAVAILGARLGQGASTRATALQEPRRRV